MTTHALYAGLLANAANWESNRVCTGTLTQCKAEFENLERQDNHDYFGYIFNIKTPRIGYTVAKIEGRYVWSAHWWQDVTD